MKFLANLLVIASLALGQFRTLPSAQAAAEKGTPTPSQTATATLPGETEPGTATPIASETPLPVAETPTPISSETATPAPTGTEVPVVETVPPAEPVIVIHLSATPEFITPGGHVNIEWAIEGISPSEHELSLHITLPKGVTPTDKDVKFDEASLTLSIPVLEESGRFGVQTDQLAEEIVLLASLLEKETSLAETSLVLASKDQFTLTAQGGEIQTEDEKIKLSFPENTFREEALIQISEPSGKDAPEYSLSGHPFSIQAQDKNSGEALHQFETEIEIKASYADLNIPDGKEENICEPTAHP